MNVNGQAPSVKHQRRVRIGLSARGDVTNPARSSRCVAPAGPANSSVTFRGVPWMPGSQNDQVQTVTGVSGPPARRCWCEFDRRAAFGLGSSAPAPRAPGTALSTPLWHTRRYGARALSPVVVKAPDEFWVLAA